MLKRLDNLYDRICDIDNINYIYHEISNRINNKSKLEHLKEYRCFYISKIYSMLKSEKYLVSPYNVFTIYEPKKRRIVSLSLQDKIVNHLVSTFIILPVTSPCLIDANVASRIGLGSKRGLELANNFHKACSIRFSNYYILKCDISKFFQSIDHDILMNKLRKRLKDERALNILLKIIESDEMGLSIGAMSSQLLAVFYLNDLDHYIKENLKIKYYVRYQDDFLLFHQSKKYLKFCLEKIKSFLAKEKLVLNKKTRIYSNKDNFLFLGRNRKGNYAKYRTVNRKLKRKSFLYSSKQIPLSSFASSIISYNYLLNKRSTLLKSASKSSTKTHSPS